MNHDTEILKLRAQADAQETRILELERQLEVLKRNVLSHLHKHKKVAEESLGTIEE